MPVEFEPTAPTGPVGSFESSEPLDPTHPVAANTTSELLAPPRRVRKSRIAIGTAVAVALIAGGIAVGLAQTSASASSTTLAAAASSSASGATPHARPTGTQARPAFKPGQPILFGAVKTVKGDTITITDQQGFTRTIVTSSKTTYKDGLTSVPAVGAKIIAQGTVDANGTTLDATTISALPTGPTGPAGPGGLGGLAGRPGGRGGAGGSGGGFGPGPGAGGPHPNATSTVKPTGYGARPGQSSKPAAPVTSAPN